jgi:hypothetical protein
VAAGRWIWCLEERVEAYRTRQGIECALIFSSNGSLHSPSVMSMQFSDLRKVLHQFVWCKTIETSVLHCRMICQNHSRDLLACNRSECQKPALKLESLQWRQYLFTVLSEQTLDAHPYCHFVPACLCVYLSSLSLTVVWRVDGAR